MLKRLLEYIISIGFGALVFYAAQHYYNLNIDRIGQYIPSWTTFVLSVLLGVVFFFVFSHFISSAITHAVDDAETKLVRMSLKELLASTLGILVGLAIANLVGIAISGYGVIGTSITVVLNIVFAYLGYRVAGRKRMK